MMNIVHNMNSINKCNPPRNSNDIDMSLKHTREKEILKYLRESCHHRIKCTAATFLVAFMWRIPLNSAILTTATHRKPQRVSDGTGSQVSVRMINKWRVRMI